MPASCPPRFADSPALRLTYNCLGEQRQECLEIDPLSFQRVGDLDQCLIDELVGFVVAEGFGGGDDLAHVGLPAVVGVEIEEGEEVFDLLEVEGGIGRDDGLGENGLAFVVDYGLAVDAHWIYRQ